MKGKIFIDTNIFVYAVLKPQNKLNEKKHFQANALLSNIRELNVVVSVQVLNEFYNSLLKYGVDDKKIQEKLYQIIDVVLVVPLTLDIVMKSWNIKTKYKFSYWDSLIVASALENNCSILYTEDMQDGQVIEEKLKIVNPFVCKTVVQK